MKGLIPDLVKHGHSILFTYGMKYWLYDTDDLSIRLVSYEEARDLYGSGVKLNNIAESFDRGIRVVPAGLPEFQTGNIVYGFAKEYDRDYVKVTFGNRSYKCGKHGIARLMKTTGAIPDICNIVQDNLSCGYIFIAGFQISGVEYVLFYSHKGLLVLNDISVMTIFDEDSNIYFPEVHAVFKFFDWIVLLVCISSERGKRCLLVFNQNGEFEGVYSYIEGSNNIVEASNLFKAKIAFFGG